MSQNEVNNEKNFNHDAARVADKLAYIGELEHEKRHAERSAYALQGLDSDEWVWYKIKAKQLEDFRRKVQRKFFPDMTDEDWCMLKVSTAIRQLAYEIGLDEDLMGESEELVDDIQSHAVGVDLSGCVACKEDRDDGTDENWGN